MKKILVIEDNTGLRENLSEILELAGYEVESAKNGKEGVEKAKSISPDLIICDVMMPELDGFGVLKILNSNPDTFDIPFIFLTAKVEKGDIRKGMGMGADDYITKPFDDTELLEAVEMRLKKSERLRKAANEGDGNVQQLFSEARAWERLKELSASAELRKYSRKDELFAAGQLPVYLYFIEEGKVKLSKSNEMGKELITHIYSSGQFFGYKAILRKKSYEAGAFAMEPTKVRLIPRNDFEELLMQDREFTAFLIQLIAKEAVETEQQLLELAYSSVRKKAANALLYFIPAEAEDQRKVTITAGRDDLASVAGTAKETLIRTLSDFKSEGLISVEGSDITILDVEKLRNIQQ